MNNFIFENSTKVAFGKGCVKEFLGGKVQEYGNMRIYQIPVYESVGGSYSLRERYLIHG